MKTMSIYESSLVLPVVDVHSKRILGKSSIALFNRGDLSFEWLVVNVVDTGGENLEQLLIPRTDVISVTEQMIAVKYFEDNPSSILTLSQEQYCEMLGARVYLEMKKPIGVCVAVNIDEASGALADFSVNTDSAEKTIYKEEIMDITSNNIINVANTVLENFELEKESVISPEVMASIDAVNERLSSVNQHYEKLIEKLEGIEKLLLILCDKNEKTPSSLETMEEKDTIVSVAESGIDLLDMETCFDVPTTQASSHSTVSRQAATLEMESESQLSGVLKLHPVEKREPGKHAVEHTPLKKNKVFWKSSVTRTLSMVLFFTTCTLMQFL